MNIHAIIPARKNSKGIPNKNIKDFNGKPLIMWSIDIAKKSRYINEIIVSTDSETIANITNAPFLRPDSLATDTSTDYEFMLHYLLWLQENKKVIPDILVHLRPTYPIRDLKTLESCIEKFIREYNNCDSLRTVTLSSKTPYKMYNMRNGYLDPLFSSINYNGTNITEPYNQCRQVLPETYVHNGCIDIIKTSTILRKHSVTGDKILAFVMDKNEVHDIDTIDDWENAEAAMNPV